eukprot:augustus_masked-scaffold_5-processed-gene-3.30-mRNA-1 protein AED:1.00 eAED:1.00 QI:0/-1/0/0/-1/1/1/0/457
MTSRIPGSNGSKKQKLSSEFSGILHPLSEEAFFEQIWEKKHVFIEGVNENDKLKFGLDDLFLNIRNNELFFSQHLNACKAINGDQITHSSDSSIKKEEAKALWETGYTFQFFQPQCYKSTVGDRLYKTLFQLEEEFSCLWGCNVYLTPNASQGLQPHYDDAEVFVVQTEGYKEWNIYESNDPASRLTLESSGPLPVEKYGKVVDTYTLKPGDVLYLPRGTIHAARTVEGRGHSVHVTISTYQRNAICDLLPSLLTSLVNDVAINNYALRVGVPIKRCDMASAESWPKLLQHQVGKAMKTLASDPILLQRVAVNSMEEFQLDFVLNRLPPPLAPPTKVKLLLGQKYRTVHPSRFALLFEEKQEEPELDDTNSEDTANGSFFLCKIYSCYGNSRESHMGLNGSNTEKESLDDCISVDVTPSQKTFLTNLKLQYPSFAVLESEEYRPLLEILNVAGVLEN